MADHPVTKSCERESNSFVDLLTFVDAIQSGDLDSAHAILLAWHTQSCDLDCSSLIPGLLGNRQHESRLLPLLQRWDRQKLVALGLDTVLDQLAQQLVPTAISALAQFAPGYYVVSGCRPSSALVDVVVLSFEGKYYCRQIKSRRFKSGCNRHSEGLLGFNYSFIGILNLPRIQGVRAIWINGTRVDFSLQNLEDSSYIDQIDDLLHLYRQAEVPLDYFPELIGRDFFALAGVLREPLRDVSKWSDWIHHDHQFGPPPSKDARTTIVIPLFRLWHSFMQGHLAAFSINPSFKHGDIELLYVIDDPSIEGQVLNWARVYLHDCPYLVRLISLRQNLGFGMACNIGTYISRTERVILMNSDVMPFENSWFDALDHFSSDYPTALVSPILLYDNYTIQHVGMHLGFSGASTSPVPCNLHRMKGLTLSQLLEKDPISYENNSFALSGAVLAFDRNLFLSLGGFDPIFGRGDFEDLHLSLLWKKEHGDLLICRSAQLMHLERQTMEILVEDKRQWQERFNACCALHLNSEVQTLAEEWSS